MSHICRYKVDWFAGFSVCKIWLETQLLPHISLSLCVQVHVPAFDILFVKYCQKTSTLGVVKWYKCHCGLIFS